MIAEGLTVSLTIPADTTVVAATGTGYQGVHTDDKDQGHGRHVEAAAQRAQGPGEAQHHALQAGHRRRQPQGRYPLGQAVAEERPEHGRRRYRAAAALSARHGSTPSMGGEMGSSVVESDESLVFINFR